MKTRTLQLTSVAMLCLGLLSCGADAPAIPPSEVRSATLGIPLAVSLLQSQAASSAENRSSALLGVHASAYMSERFASRVQSSLLGINQVQVLLGQEPGTDSLLDETYMLLTSLGEGLSVEIQDLLNRSTNRAKTLDEYIVALKAVSQESVTRHGLLESERDRVAATVRDRRSVATALERDQRTAVADQNFSRAGEIQKELQAAHTDLDAVEREEEELRDLIQLFEDLLEIADERIVAIEANREVLVAGLKVIDVPGIEGIGVVEEGGTRRAFLQRRR